MRTCKRLGIKTVAVHSTVDSRACHVTMADEAICIGPAASLESYLSIPKVLNAIETTNASAVHPGYGFLSENPRFSQSVSSSVHNCKFVGPCESAIRDMGDKITSKRIAQDAGVNTIPGYEGVISDEEEAVRIANRVGYPIMIKATAGGGGKGMRICYTDSDTREGFRLSTAEAKNFFNDERLFIEKYIERPHHIEIQILSGKNKASGELEVLCFPERECSVQRRNQKILEESPSTLLNTNTRREMVRQCHDLVHATRYESAGTVEFLVDEEQNFYFLEMNTRLQVEHPVTEMITGVDLVELMIRVAAGEGVPRELLVRAEESESGMVPHVGWAVEGRVYAEDPIRGFLPSTGPLLQYQEPPSSWTPLPTSTDDGHNTVSIRVDSGVSEGSDISVHYDPMISKLIAHGPTRTTAIRGLTQALDRYLIRGVNHNAPFLHSVLRQDEFMKGDTPTDFISRHYPDGFSGVKLSDKEKGGLAAVVVAISGMRREMLGQPPLPMEYEDEDGHQGFVSQSLLGGQEDIPETEMYDEFGDRLEEDSYDDEEEELFESSKDEMEVATQEEFDLFLTQGNVTNKIVTMGGMFGDDGVYDVALNYSTGETMVREVVDGENNEEHPNGTVILKTTVEDVNYDPSSPFAEIVVNGEASAIQIHGESNTDILSIQMHGAAIDTMVMTHSEYQLVKHMHKPQKVDTSSMLTSPMPGTLISMAVKEGDAVELGQELCNVEAMKMQNVLRSEKKGVIGRVRATVGASLKADEIILEFVDENEAEVAS